MKTAEEILNECALRETGTLPGTYDGDKRWPDYILQAMKEYHNQMSQLMSGEGKTAERILEKHCPSMNNLYLDEHGRNFRDRVVAAMKEHASLTPNKGLSAEGIAMPAYFAGYANGSLPIEKALAFYKDWFKRNFPPKEQPVKLLTAEEVMPYQKYRSRVLLRIGMSDRLSNDEEDLLNAAYEVLSAPQEQKGFKVPCTCKCEVDVIECDKDCYLPKQKGGQE